MRDDLKYHGQLTSEIEGLLADFKSQIDMKLGEIETVKDDLKAVLSAIGHMKELSAKLDGLPADPSGAISTATEAFGNYSALYSEVHDPISRISEKKADHEGTRDFLSAIWGRYSGLLHKLITNAIASVKKLAKELGIKEFSITVSSTPPSVSATLYF